MLKDPYGRPLESIRISVTQRCNLNCFYCHREGEDQSKKGEMTPEEIQRIVAIAASFGLGEVKLTGGEPLIRRDILEIVTKIHETPGVKEVSMTTNGILLPEYAYDLKKAGLARVNVSLDTLKSEIYKQITGVDALKSVTFGIARAKDAGLHPVKVNMVLLKGLNEHEVPEMIDFARKNGVILQIIELESPNEDEFYERYHASLDVVERLLKGMAESITVRRMHHRKKYHLRGGGEVEVVRESRARDHAQNRHGGVGVAATRQNQLPQRAAAEQDASQPDKRHSDEVPEMPVMRDRLPRKAEMNLADDQIADERHKKYRSEAAQKMRVANEE